MKTKKQLGIWMDHSVAYLTELTQDALVTETVESKPKSKVNPDDLYFKDESHQLNKEQGMLSAYYKKLGELIQDYDEVLLFGPTDAKNELLNHLKADNLFDKIKIDAVPADKMSEFQQHAFIREYFHPAKQIQD